jgi:Holliday junction DNA helicase RuvA
MIGVLTGQVLFSDGVESILQTSSGTGYQIFCAHIFPEGDVASVYVSHIVRETAELLFAFTSLRDKKLFELMTTVKGVGPKSAYSIVSQISLEEIVRAVSTDQKAILTKVSGVGAKAASQIILDLGKKIHKISMYSGEPLSVNFSYTGAVEVNSKKASASSSSKLEKVELTLDNKNILNDTILACENLGFQTEKVIPLAQRILKENTIKKTEQLIHLVLKEI